MDVATLLSPRAQRTLLALSLLLVACAPTASPPTRETGGAPSPATTSAAHPSAAWQATWDQVVAAARREGRVDISAAPGQAWRDSLTAFSREYPDIQVHYTGLNSRDFWPRLFQERAAGQMLFDLRVGGTDASAVEAKNRGLLESVRAALLLPEVVDDTKWLGGHDHSFADNEKQYLFAFLGDAGSNIVINRDFIAANELQTGRELLDPRWRGRIVLQDPRAGSGQAQLMLLLIVYGEDFVRDLLTKQDVAVTGDIRQMAEWVVRGRYPIGIGVNTDQQLMFREQGLGLNVKPVRSPVALGGGFGSLQLMSQAPHPNAVRVFVNWLLTRDAQAQLTQAVGSNSRRVDVPTVDPDRAADPARLDEYITYQFEKYVWTREVIDRLVKEAGH
jgi:ABC-type Fe3+ transport system substrate-binding protein